DKALDIVQFLGERGETGLGELARELGLNRSTTHHLLATLRRHGFVDQDERTKAYRLGYGMVAVVNLFLGRNDLFAAAVGPTRAPRAARGGRAQSKVVRAPEQPALIPLPGWPPVQVRAPFSIGEPDLYRTAAGKSLLAFQPPSKSKPLTAALPFPRFTAT